MIDVAVLERAAGEGELFGAAIKHDGAFHEGAAIKAGKMNLAAEIKYLGVNGIIPEYASSWISVTVSPFSPPCR
ncbi:MULTISPECIES: hypothetical protein [Bradyrhizobium]|uniref:Uncharacterized protein n=3 Tax=Bradyrhizobium TaxID=374 RepID=A0ABS3MVD5_9BRAD|nr:MULTISPECIES: hypothetical protein [Bradyrhizobium]UFX49381.1 hypothetical protein HAP47_0040565 [Bradyrhizobium sp. 41S5]UGY07477.1 hypothetical protein J4P68_0040650 [Bradyrhizobium quebecense]